MYVKVLLIDYLDSDGVLTTYRAHPKGDSGPVVLDRLADVRGPSLGRHDLDMGGARVYNSDRVEIIRSSTRIRDFSVSTLTTRVSYGIEHMGLDVGFSRNAEGGMYYFIGPLGFRARKLFVSDPYDRRTDDDYRRKQFYYNFWWDDDLKCQMIEMPLRSSRGTFSWRTGGVFELWRGGDGYVDCEVGRSIVSRVVGEGCLRGGGGNAILEDWLKKVEEWVEVKPGIFGLSVDIKKMLRDLIGGLGERR